LHAEEGTRKFLKDCRWGYDVILFAFWKYQCDRNMEDDSGMILRGAAERREGCSESSRPGES